MEITTDNYNVRAVDGEWRRVFGRRPTADEIRKVVWAIRARQPGYSPIGGSMDGPRWIRALRDAGLLVCARKHARERDGHSRDLPMGGYVASARAVRLFGGAS